MKKFARILCLTLVAVMLCAALASCGAPAKDPADAVAALKEAGYTVTVDTDALVSAVKDGEHITIHYYDDADKAAEKYEDLKEAKEKAEEALKEAEDKLAEKQKEVEDMEDGLAKNAAEAIVDQLQKAVDAAKEEADVVVGKSGSMAWVGTKQAVKDAK